MKKLVILLSLLAIAVCGAITLAACKGDEPHEHFWGEYTVTREATCTQEGEQVRYCSGCDESETVAIPVIPHDEYVVEEGYAATCTEEGLSDFTKCRVCGETLSEHTVIAKLPHTEEIIEHGYAATCTAKGLTDLVKCSVCGTTISEQTELDMIPHDYTGVAWVMKTPFQDPEGDIPAVNGTHSRHCTVCGYEDIDECSYTTVYVAETCEDGGYHTHHCVVCSNHIKHDDLPAKGHNMSEEPIYAGYYYNDGNYVYRHKYICLNGCGKTDYEDCAKVAGDTVAPTCTKAGYTNYNCEQCGHTYTDDSTAKLGHDFSGAPSPDSSGKWSHIYTCTRENCGVTKSEKCTMVTNTVTKRTCDTALRMQTVCTVCNKEGQTYAVAGQEALGHDLSGWEHCEGDQHTQFCRREGCDYSDTQPCNYVETEIPATCLTAGSIERACEVCLHKETEDGDSALGHNYSDWTIGKEGAGGTHYKVCRNAGCDESIPDHKITESCNFTSMHTEPDCTTAGSDYYKCEVCNNEYSDIIPEKGHQWLKGSDDKIEYTITDENHKRKCGVCGFEETTAHSYTVSNFCDMCGLDALEYADVGADCIVYSGRKLSAVKEITVPEYHDGKRVIAINDGHPESGGNWMAFYGMKNIVKVTLPASIQSIGYGAFDSCTNLAEVIIDSGENNEKASELTTIEKYAFSHCNSLARINLPASVRTIGECAFYHCTKLSNINIPFVESPDNDNVIDIERHAFYNTAFYNDSSHWSGDALYISHHLIKVAPDHFSADGVTRFVVKDGTVTISANAFEDCEHLETVELPTTLKEIGNDAFLNCTHLSEVVFGGKFGDWLSIAFGNDYSSPMAYAHTLHIEGATGAIEIPENVTSIPAGAFKGSVITSVTIHSKVVSIGEEAFENCANLETVIIDGAQISYMGSNVFAGTPFYENADNWDSDGALYVGNCLVAVKPDVTNLEIKAGTVSIAVAAFAGNESLQTVVIPESVVYIGAGAFANCAALKTIELEDTKNWFATSTVLGIGRAQTVYGNALDNFELYDGSWRKM